MAAFAITQAFAGLTLRGSSAGNVATSKPIAAKAHFGGVRALGKSAFAQRAKAQRLQVRAEAEADGASEANAATQATTRLGEGWAEWAKAPGEGAAAGGADGAQGHDALVPR